MSDLENNESVENLEETDTPQDEMELGGTVIIAEEVTPKKALKQVRNVIRGYEDYYTVQARRNSDKVFREFVQANLEQTNDKIKEIHALLIERQQMSAWSTGDGLINDIGSFVRDIEKGSYGFTTFFENPKLLEMDISQLYLIDNDFLLSLGRLRERTLAFMVMAKQNYFEDIDLWFETLNRLIGRLIRLNEDRAKLIGSYERISY